MRIDVFSDVVCPWCYLGERRLTEALDGLEGAEGVEVRWRAFQLDPTATAEPRPLRPAIEAKYGPGAFDAMTSRLSALGAEVGIDYRFDRALRVTSVPALSLAAWAADTAGLAVANALHERLFAAYFTDGANIADPAVLAELAEAAGLDRDAAVEAIAARAGRAEVQADLAEAHERGITGVPSFVIDDRWTVPGAQDVEWLRAAIGRVLAAAP